VLNAVAAAHEATGVPVMVHTDARLQTGLAAQAVLRARGVDASRLLISHCGDSVDLDYLTRLMDAGSIIGMDRFGVETLLSFEDRVRVTAALCARGYADHMVLAHDACCVSDWFPADYEQHHPKWTMTHIQDDVVPALLDAGVTETQIDIMLRAVPRAYFE
jgi:phosphotriesterase-related protein